MHQYKTCTDLNYKMDLSIFRSFWTIISLLLFLFQKYIFNLKNYRINEKSWFHLQCVDHPSTYSIAWNHAKILGMIPFNFPNFLAYFRQQKGKKESYRKNGGDYTYFTGASLKSGKISSLSFLSRIFYLEEKKAEKAWEGFFTSP